MRIILSPAKKVNVDTDKIECQGLPMQNYKRIREMDLHNRLTPAILSYEGIAYQYMAPAVFEDSSFDYVQEHLRIFKVILI